MCIFVIFFPKLLIYFYFFIISNMINNIIFENINIYAGTRLLHFTSFYLHPPRHPKGKTTKRITWARQVVNSFLFNWKWPRNVEWEEFLVWVLCCPCPRDVYIFVIWNIKNSFSIPHGPRQWIRECATLWYAIMFLSVTENTISFRLTEKPRIRNVARTFMLMVFIS